MQAENQIKYQPSVDDIKKEALEYCRTSRSKEEILNFIGVEVSLYNFKKYITGLISSRILTPVNLYHLRDPHQKYIITGKGIGYLKSIAI